MALGIVMEELKKLDPESFIVLVQETIDQMPDTGNDAFLRDVMLRLLKAYKGMNEIRKATSMKTIATIMEDAKDV